MGGNPCLNAFALWTRAPALDTTAPLHHTINMRLTINLDEDLHRMAKSLAISEDCSISAAVNQLLRRTMAPEVQHNARCHSKNGLPVVKCKRPVTDEDVYRAEEEETIRHWIS